MANLVDLLHRQIGRLTVVERLGVLATTGRNRPTMWRCICSCPPKNEVMLPTARLTKKEPTKSCGCLQRESIYRLHTAMAGLTRNRANGSGTGRRWAKLPPKPEPKPQPKPKPIAVKNNQMPLTPEIVFDYDQWVLKQWQAIILRCTDPDSKYYYVYGGSGISIDPDWQTDFTAFKTWVNQNLPPITTKLTLLRIDLNGDFVPGNLKWASGKF